MGVEIPNHLITSLFPQQLAPTVRLPDSVPNITSLTKTLMWLKEVCYEQQKYSAIKKDEILPFAKTCKELEYYSM